MVCGERECVISPSVLTAIQEKGDNWLPPRELLLGVGEPWEPFPFDSRYNTREENCLLVTAVRSVLHVGADSYRLSPG